mmetsp:Transcript_20432/g.52002  ORF Transcript_20432/g.52002 Transcript_20432/m.52002 type:complete len:250 (-) Transcript_20432:268-1017(-)
MRPVPPPLRTGRPSVVSELCGRYKGRGAAMHAVRGHAGPVASCQLHSRFYSPRLTRGILAVSAQRSSASRVRHVACHPFVIWAELSAVRMRRGTIRSSPCPYGTHVVRVPHESIRMREGGLVDINERAARAIANQLHAEVVLTLQHVQDGLRPVAGLVDAHGRAHCPQRMQGGTLMREGGQITGVARISALCMPSCSFLPPRPLVVEQPASWKEDEHIHVVAFLGEAQRVVGRRAEAVVEKRRARPYGV